MGGSVEYFNSLQEKITSITIYWIDLKYAFAIGEVGIAVQYVDGELPRVIIELQYRNQTITAPVLFERLMRGNVSGLCGRMLELLFMEDI